MIQSLMVTFLVIVEEIIWSGKCEQGMCGVAPTTSQDKPILYLPMVHITYDNKVVVTEKHDGTIY
jgi:hypothetical protein